MSKARLALASSVLAIHPTGFRSRLSSGCPFLRHRLHAAGSIACWLLIPTRGRQRTAKRIPPAASNDAKATAFRAFTLFINMALNTPSARATTRVEMSVAVANPAATAVAAFTVETSSGTGTHAEAARSDTRLASAPPDSTMPRQSLGQLAASHREPS